MSSHQINKNLRPAKKHHPSINQLRNSDPDHLALPQAEIRRLVERSMTGNQIEPFVRRMLSVMDNLKAGRVAKVKRLRVSRLDKSRAVLITAIVNAAKHGRTLAAHETAFLAALYAYENSLDHLRAFMKYSDRFRKTAAKIQSGRLKLR